MLHIEDVQTLMGLGLTSLQAKLYLALIRTGRCTVRKIAETADVARQEAQRVTAELQSLGLVEKVLVNPTEYQPVPITDVISFLLERREKASLELQKDAHRLLMNFENNPPRAPSEEEIQFVITTGKEAIIKKSKEIVDRTMKSLDVINGHWKNICFAGTVFKEQNIQALKRHVRIRILTEKLPNDQFVHEIYDHCLGEPLFEIKYVPSPLPAMLGIYDKRELLDCTSTERPIGDSPILWTNSPALIAAAQTYFDKLWKQARPPNAKTKTLATPIMT